MKKRILSLLVLILCMSLLTGCMCKHEVWNDADCVTPKTCAECGETEGEALGHVWLAANCVSPKTCEVCGTTDGAAKGHSWVEATCEVPKTCAACNLTEGDPLGHNWEEATTETPKTCTVCSVTEGERIITDPRFTTAATKDIQGLWACEFTMTGEEMGLDSGIIDEVTLRVLIDLCNDGTMVFSVGIPDEEAFMNQLIDAYTEVLYAEFAAYDMDRAAADEAMKQTYGMGVREYMESTLGSFSFNDLLASIYAEMGLGGIYFIQDGILYTGTSWTSAVIEEPYTLTGDTLIIDSLSETLGHDTILTRVTE